MSQSAERGPEGDSSGAENLYECPNIECDNNMTYITSTEPSAGLVEEVELACRNCEFVWTRYWDMDRIQQFRDGIQEVIEKEAGHIANLSPDAFMKALNREFNSGDDSESGLDQAA